MAGFRGGRRARVEVTTFAGWVVPDDGGYGVVAGAVWGGPPRGFRTGEPLPGSDGPGKSPYESTKPLRSGLLGPIVGDQALQQVDPVRCLGEQLGAHAIHHLPEVELDRSASIGEPRQPELDGFPRSRRGNWSLRVNPCVRMSTTSMKFPLLTMLAVFLPTMACSHPEPPAPSLGVVDVASAPDGFAPAWSGGSSVDGSALIWSGQIPSAETSLLSEGFLVSASEDGSIVFDKLPTAPVEPRTGHITAGATVAWLYGTDARRKSLQEWCTV
jgi:hypothetical protein